MTTVAVQMQSGVTDINTTMKKIFSLFAIATTALFISCSDDDATPGVGTLTLEFDNVVSTANLELNTSTNPYINSNGEEYRITWLSYYVSNIKLKREDGTVYEDEIKSDGSAGYYLVKEDETGSHEITLKDIPAGNYTEVTFTIGVDANQVDQGAQTGPLDPAKGLFWSWNSGYIFLAIEGVSPVSTETDNTFAYHVGGYKEDASNPNLVNNLKTLTLSFNGDFAPVRAEHEPQVHLLFDVDKFFNGSGADISFSSNASRHSPKACQDVAGNIPAAFSVDHVHAN